MIKLKRDRFRATRGGTSRVLDVCCAKCEEHICFYQKDGPGILKRMYIDRMLDTQPDGGTLTCPACQQVLAVRTVYEKEDRPAYRLFVGAVSKKVVALSEVALLS